MGEWAFALCCLPLTPRCPETDRLSVITSPQGPVCQSEWWNCLGGELEANFRPGDSLPTVVAGQQLGWAACGKFGVSLQGALDTALQVCSHGHIPASLPRLQGKPGMSFLHTEGRTLKSPLLSRLPF